MKEREREDTTTYTKIEHARRTICKKQTRIKWHVNMSVDLFLCLSCFVFCSSDGRMRWEKVMRDQELTGGGFAGINLLGNMIDGKTRE